MTDQFMEYLYIIAIAALIVFSAWCFYLNFKANRVCTIKDLLMAFISGGSLAVIALVFGITDDIREVSDSIKQDTVVIRENVGAGQPFEPGPGPDTSVFREQVSVINATTAQNNEGIEGLMSGHERMFSYFDTLTRQNQDIRARLDRVLEIAGGNANLLRSLLNALDRAPSEQGINYDQLYADLKFLAESQNAISNNIRELRQVVEELHAGGGDTAAEPGFTLQQQPVFDGRIGVDVYSMSINLNCRLVPEARAFACDPVPKR